MPVTPSSSHRNHPSHAPEVCSPARQHLATAVHSPPSSRPTPPYYGSTPPAMTLHSSQTGLARVAYPSAYTGAFETGPAKMFPAGSRYVQEGAELRWEGGSVVVEQVKSFPRFHTRLNDQAARYRAPPLPSHPQGMWARVKQWACTSIPSEDEIRIDTSISLPPSTHPPRRRHAAATHGSSLSRDLFCRITAARQRQKSAPEGLLSRGGGGGICGGVPGCEIAGMPHSSVVSENFGFDQEPVWLNRELAVVPVNDSQEAEIDGSVEYV